MDAKKAAKIQKLELKVEQLRQQIEKENDPQKKQKLVAQCDKLQIKIVTIKKGKILSREAKRDLVAYSFIAPNFIGFAVFTLIPIVFAFALARGCAHPLLPA